MSRKTKQSATVEGASSLSQTSIIQAPTQPQWLSLKEASEFLGIHFTTLRLWADGGDIRVFRTPGGHRRFSLADLRRFLEERATHPPAPDESALVEAAVGRTRQEIQKMAPEALHWHYALDESAARIRQQRGRQLFALAIAFVLKPGQRAQILQDGKALGWAYGQEAGQNGVSLVAAGRAVRFFRSQLIQAVRREEKPDYLDAEDVRVQKLIDQFLDEVLFAVLGG
ncbi:MAG: helix-turn-helix domain-containing protein, partial [Chloroflexota bacterium]|nr:helix-turn-helix domain-containing protein [Chloroflexota bacterium]